MENKVLENAVDDISLIKNIIESTRKSFVGFSKIFIAWGILFGAFALIQWMQSMNMQATMDFYTQYNELVLLIPLVFVILAGVIYRSVVRKQPLIGLERHLMLLWIMILLLQFMPTRVSVSSMSDPNMTQVITTTSNFSITVFSLGIALLMTSVLTGLNKLKYLSVFYFLLAIIHGYLPSLSMSFSLAKLGYVILPFTLLFTGVYLKKHHDGSDLNGTKLNS